MSGDVQSVLGAAMTLPAGPLVGADAPPIPDVATEDALAILQMTCGRELAEKARRRWWAIHALCESGEQPRPTPRAFGTHDPGCRNCHGLGFTTDLSHFEEDHKPKLVPCTCRGTQPAPPREHPEWSMLPLWRHATFDQIYTQEKRDGQAIGFQVVSVFAVDDEAAFLTIVGDIRAGKSYMAACALNYLAEARQRRVLFVSAAELMDRLRGAFNPNVGAGYDEMFERVRRIDVLGLDDLGAESTTEWVAEKMYLLLDERLRLGRKTIVTTNLPPTLLGRRVAGRLFMEPANLRLVIGYDGPLSEPTKWHKLEDKEVICRLCHQAPHDFTCDHAA